MLHPKPAICLEDISEHFKPLRACKHISGPLSLRHQLRQEDGQHISQAQLGQLLGEYSRRTYTRATVCIWERIERGKSLPKKYAMTNEARDAYRQLLAEITLIATKNEIHLKAWMGKRAWKFEARKRCKYCGRPFKPKSLRTARCGRCAR